MANLDRVNGARPVKHRNGSPYNGQVTQYYIPSSDSTAVFVGDFVKLAGGASTDGYSTVAQAAAGDPVIGVVVGFRADPADLNTPVYRRASTARYALVADSPDLIYEIQCDDVGSTVAAADVGLNANFVVAAGSTSTGASGMELDSSTKATTATLPLKILSVVDRVDNELGVANQKVLVSINNHQFGSHTGTAGV